MPEAEDTPPPRPKLETAKTELKRRRPGAKLPIVVAASFAIFIALLQQMQFFHPLDNGWTDSLFRHRGIEAADPRVIVVEIDDASLKKIGSFPFPRGVYARLIDRLVELGVKVVALDVLFIDPSTPEQDALLVAVTTRHEDVVVHSAMLDPDVNFENRIIMPFPALEKAASHIGIVNQALIDADGSVRQASLVIGRKHRRQLGIYEWAKDPMSLPSLGLKALSVFEGKPIKHYLDRVGISLWLNFRGEEFQVVGKQMVNGVEQPMISHRRGFPHIPIWKVLDRDLSEFDLQRLKGAIVVVGSTAIGYFDHFPNPFSESMAGLNVHATLIDNILADRHLREVPVLFVHLAIFFFALVAYKLLRFGPVQSALIVLATVAGWGFFSYFLFLRHKVLPFWGPVLALAAPYIVLMIYKVVLEQAAKKEVRQMFGQYVSPEVVNILVRDPSKLQLGGQRKDMTMFFLDIAHFTSISEKMQPEKLIQFLNTYLTALTDDILRNNGVVDKYIGDCIMAFWNAPLDEPDHRRKACLAAIDCVATIERLNREYVDPTMPEKPAVRIGLNSGEVIVGNTGSARKLAYTVLGDEVNLSSRLEGANKFFGSTAMVSENTLKGAKDDVEVRLLGNVRVIGKEIPIKVYELLARKGALSPAWAKALPEYNAAIEFFFVGNFEEAKKGFSAVQALIPGDQTSKLYLSACDDYMLIPPQGDWKIFNLTSK